MHALSASVQQLEMERNQLMEQLTSTSQLKDALLEKVELLVKEKDESSEYYSKLRLIRIQ